MSVQEKKRQRICDLLNAETKQKFICLPSRKQRKNAVKELFLRKKKDWRSEQKTKIRLFSCSRYGNYKGPHCINKNARQWIESPRENCEDRN